MTLVMKAIKFCFSIKVEEICVGVSAFDSSRWTKEQNQVVLRHRIMHFPTSQQSEQKGTSK